MLSLPIPVPSLGPDHLLGTHRSHGSAAQTARQKRPSSGMAFCPWEEGDMPGCFAA